MAGFTSVSLWHDKHGYGWELLKLVYFLLLLMVPKK